MQCIMQKIIQNECIVQITKKIELDVCDRSILTAYPLYLFVICISLKYTDLLSFYGLAVLLGTWKTLSSV